MYITNIIYLFCNKKFKLFNYTILNNRKKIPIKYIPFRLKLIWIQRLILFIIYNQAEFAPSEKNASVIENCVVYTAPVIQ